MAGLKLFFIRLKFDFFCVENEKIKYIWIVLIVGSYSRVYKKPNDVNQFNDSIFHQNCIHWHIHTHTYIVCTSAKIVCEKKKKWKKKKEDTRKKLASFEPSSRTRAHRMHLKIHVYANFHQNQIKPSLLPLYLERKWHKVEITQFKKLDSCKILSRLLTKFIIQYTMNGYNRWCILYCAFNVDPGNGKCSISFTRLHMYGTSKIFHHYISLNDWFDKKRFEIEEEKEWEKSAQQNWATTAKRDTTNLNLDLY